MFGYDDFHCMIIWYEGHLNVNMCILRICMVLVYAITKCEYTDWWSFNVSGGATGIEPSTWQGHPTGGAGKWPPPFSIIILDPWNDFFIKLLLFGYDY